MKTLRKTNTNSRKSQSPREAVIDEIGRLDLELKELKPKADRLKALKKIAESWGADLPAEQAALFDGHEWALQLSEREFETAITDMEAVFRMLGQKRFLEVATVTLKALKESLTAAQIATVTRKERTGSRSVKPLRRAAPAAAA